MHAVYREQKDTICLTISEGLCRSMRRLWMRIWNLSQVLEPSPQGVFLVVMRRTLVGMRTGPFTFRDFSLAPLIRSAHTEGKRNISYEVPWNDKITRSFSILDIKLIVINARIMNRTFISNLEPRKDNYEILTFTSEKIMCPSLPDFSNHTVGI